MRDLENSHAEVSVLSVSSKKARNMLPGFPFSSVEADELGYYISYQISKTCNVNRVSGTEVQFWKGRDVAFVRLK